MKEEEEERERLNIEMKAMKKQFDMIEEAKNNDDTSSIINEDDDDGDNTSNNNNNNKARNDVNDSKLNEMKNDYRQILIDFFDKHDPPRLATIDALLDKHEGKEEELLDGLIEKYAD